MYMGVAAELLPLLMWSPMSSRESRSRSPTPRWQSPTRTLTSEFSQPGSPRESRNIKESASSDSIACETVPKLPSMLSTRDCKLIKRPQSATSPGWGVVLRGTTTTTSESKEGPRIYTCHIDSVTEQGAAYACGLTKDDQILCINGKTIKDHDHSDVIKIFQNTQEVSLTILPAKYKFCTSARINYTTRSFLNHIWSLGRTINSLEVIGVNLGSDQQVAELDLSSLVVLQSLSLHHCSLDTLCNLKGLECLSHLEHLSLAHNILTNQSLRRNSPISELKTLKRLNLSRNLLSQLPDCLLELTSLEVLIVTDNNITELPTSLKSLTKLQTLCIDGNLLKEVDRTVLLLPRLQKLTMANNQLETESLAVKHRQLLITNIEGNPYTVPDQSGMVTRNEPSLRRTVSVRGILHLSSKQKQRLSMEMDTKSNEYHSSSSPVDDDIYIATQ